MKKSEEVRVRLENAELKLLKAAATIRILLPYVEQVYQENVFASELEKQNCCLNFNGAKRFLEEIREAI